MIRHIEVKSPQGKDTSGLVEMLNGMGVSASLVPQNGSKREVIEVNFEGNYIDQVFSPIGRAQYHIISDRILPEQPTQKTKSNGSYK